MEHLVVLKTHKPTEYWDRIMKTIYSSCWVFQPVGRWFSSQDNKRSLDGFCVSLCPIKTE